MVVIEALKSRFNRGEMPELYFMRDSRGLEADMVFRKSNQLLIPIEIKGGMTWNREFTKNLLKLRQLSPKFHPGYVVYAGDLTPEIDDVRFINYRDTYKILQ